MFKQLFSKSASAAAPEQSEGASPKVSIVIICYNMAREVPRTVRSFLPPYQKDLQPEDVEIIVLENGSSQPVAEDIRMSWPGNVKYIQIKDPKPSPAHALNYGVKIARAPIVCPVIDGARMASPGLLSSALKALKISDQAFVASIGYHLGSKLQQEAVDEGYNQAVEDELIRSINWPQDGYKLFEICAPAGSARSGWFGTLSETNAPFLTKSLYESLGGYDERFDIPGGGLVNLDFLNRVVERPGIDYMLVMGEATFHQFHGGVTTSRRVALKEADGESTWSKYTRQYEDIRGKPFQATGRRPILFGSFPPAASTIAKRGLEFVLGQSQ